MLRRHIPVNEFTSRNNGHGSYPFPFPLDKTLQRTQMANTIAYDDMYIFTQILLTDEFDSELILPVRCPVFGKVNMKTQPVKPPASRVLSEIDCNPVRDLSADRPGPPAHPTNALFLLPYGLLQIYLLSSNFFFTSPILPIPIRALQPERINENINPPGRHLR